MVPTDYPLRNDYSGRLELESYIEELCLANSSGADPFLNTPANQSYPNDFAAIVIRAADFLSSYPPFIYDPIVPLLDTALSTLFLIFGQGTYSYV